MRQRVVGAQLAVLARAPVLLVDVAAREPVVDGGGGGELDAVCGWGSGGAERRGGEVVWGGGGAGSLEG